VDTLVAILGCAFWLAMGALLAIRSRKLGVRPETTSVWRRMLIAPSLSREMITRQILLHDRLAVEKELEKAKLRRASFFVSWIATVSRLMNRSQLVTLPPGRRLKRIAELFCSAEICDKVIDEMIEDMRDEYHRHLSNGDKPRALLRLWAYRFAIARAIGTESGLTSLVREIFRRVSQ
jgi:hypothetical protein